MLGSFLWVLLSPLELWSLKPLVASLMLSRRLKQKIQPLWLFSERDSVRKTAILQLKEAEIPRTHFENLFCKPMVFFTWTLTQSVQLNPLKLDIFLPVEALLCIFDVYTNYLSKNKNNSLNIQNIFNSSAEQNNLSIELSVKWQSIYRVKSYHGHCLTAELIQWPIK